jgi:hypothetical protein
MRARQLKPDSKNRVPWKQDAEGRLFTQEKPGLGREQDLESDRKRCFATIEESELRR